jgi:hypothetical protein
VFPGAAARVKQATGPQSLIGEPREHGLLLADIPRCGTVPAGVRINA